MALANGQVIYEANYGCEGKKRSDKSKSGSHLCNLLFYCFISDLLLFVFIVFYVYALFIQFPLLKREVLIFECFINGNKP